MISTPERTSDDLKISCPTKCAACGDYWVTPDGKWNVCIDCPHRTVMEIGQAKSLGTTMSIDLSELIAFLRTF